MPQAPRRGLGRVWRRLRGGLDTGRPGYPDARASTGAVVARLEPDPALRYSFDVQGATATAPADGTVSVLLGLRVADGSIVTAELRIPGNRWPGIALFNEHLRLAAEAKPS